MTELSQTALDVMDDSLTKSPGVDQVQSDAILADSKLSPEQEAEFKEAFEKFDAGSGRIGLHELKVLMLSKGIPVKIIELAANVDHLHPSNDGTLDYDQFIDIVSMYEEGDVPTGVSLAEKYNPSDPVEGPAEEIPISSLDALQFPSLDAIQLPQLVSTGGRRTITSTPQLLRSGHTRISPSSFPVPVMGVFFLAAALAMAAIVISRVVRRTRQYQVLV